MNYPKCAVVALVMCASCLVGCQTSGTKTAAVAEEVFVLKEHNLVEPKTITVRVGVDLAIDLARDACISMGMTLFDPAEPADVIRKAKFPTLLMSGDSEQAMVGMVFSPSPGDVCSIQVLYFDGPEKDEAGNVIPRTIPHGKAFYKVFERALNNSFAKR